MMFRSLEFRVEGLGGQKTEYGIQETVGSMQIGEDENVRKGEGKKMNNV